MQGVDRLRRYLESRGLSGRFPDALTLTREPYYIDGQDWGDFYVMSAEIHSPAGELVSRHRTYLSDRDDGKLIRIDDQAVDARKLAKGKIPKGSAIRLSPIGDVLAIAEGIETALAVREGSGALCWSCVSAVGIQNFIPPSEVRLVEIWGDNDASGIGQKAAATASRRLREEGFEVRLVLPTEEGEDWLDVLNRAGEDVMLSARERASKLWASSPKGREAFEEALLREVLGL